MATSRHLVTEGQQNLETVIFDYLGALREGDEEALHAVLDPNVTWQGLHEEWVCHGLLARRVQGRNPSVRISHVNEKWRDERLFDVEDVFHALSLKRWMGIGSEWNKRR